MKPSAAGRRGPLFYLLLCGLIAVWGSVLIRVGTGVSDGDEEGGTAPAPSVAALPEGTPRARPPAYEASFRDPFAWPPGLSLSPDTGEAAVLPASEPGPVRQQLVLEGIVDGTALLRGPDGASLFGRAGETVAGVRILRVRPGEVGILFEGDVLTLRLDE